MDFSRSMNNQMDVLSLSKGVSCENNNQIEPLKVGDLKTSNDTGGVDTAISNLLDRLPDLNTHFQLYKKIGEGTFSNVYLASIKKLGSTQKFAVKHLIPTCHPKRIKYELDCLNKIGGKDNVVSCELTLRKEDCVVFVMPYLPHQKFSDYVLDMSVEETRVYMKNLFLALRRVHSFNIIHRDIKPSNFLYNRDTKEFLLVDFGLAQSVEETEKPQKTKQSITTKIAVTKRKREDDDVENAENPPLKRTALQTFTQDSTFKQDKAMASWRFSRQPLSIEQRKCQDMFHPLKPLENMVKRQPLTTTSNNIINVNQKPTFQSLMPEKSPVDKGASFVRVQNSQVQTGSLFPKPVAPVRRKEPCDCTGKPQVCNNCLTRRGQYAARAGTPGFRPPEVLLKYPYQTTAVDMWAAGVIMLCIVSGTYPFFRSPDDLMALSEQITVFGTTAIVNLANKLGRNVICKEIRKPLTLWVLAENLRRRKMAGGVVKKTDIPVCPECRHSPNPDNGCLCEDKVKFGMESASFPRAAYDLLARLLDIDPASRISAEQALQHSFITGSK